MKKPLSESTILFCLLPALFAMFFCLSFFAEATYDSGDGIRHYLVSRYSWKHPELFVYSWGKPFFTALSSPFSQFGMIGANVFNIICAIASSFICFKLAKKLNLKYPFLVIVFLCFTPIYFPTINSGLTEPLFGLVLILSIYLIFDKKFFWATLLVSFLPFVRSEGYLFFPLFIAVLIFRNKWKYFPMLAFGTVFYTIAGSFHYKDILWLIHQNPYKGLNYNIYGHGEFLHFIKEYKPILGVTIGLLFLFGLLAAFIFLIQKRKLAYKETETNTFTFEEHFLIYGSFLAYFFAHTVFWWKGMGSSLGLIRVMAGIIPCSALICLRGFNFIMLPLFIKNKLIEWSIIIIIPSYIIYSCFNCDFFPYKLNSETAVLKEVADWYKTSPFVNKKVYYLYPYLAEALDVDAFDENKVGELWGLYPSLKEWGPSVIPDSTLIIWDGHFGPNEGAIPLEKLLNDPLFDLVKSFKPKIPFKTLGDYEFEAYLFMKLSKPKQSNINLDKEIFDLDKLNHALVNTVTISNLAACSGKNSCRLAKDVEFSVNIEKEISEIPQGTSEIAFNFKLLDETQSSLEAKAVMVIDDKDGKNLYWSGLPFERSESENTKWKSASVRFTLIPNISPKSIIKFYVWNIAKKEFYIDDLELEYWGRK